MDLEWTTPAPASTRETPAPAPAPEEEEALFLESPPASPPADILALFDPSPPASPSANNNEWTTSIDISALEAAARRKALAAAPSQHEILPSSSPPQRPRSASPKGKGGKAGKKRARPRILDESRLLDAQKGFPRLIRDMQAFKVKGKGHEASDLNRLMGVYQYWIHDLYPKEQFKDTVGRVEKLCHSRRMNAQLSSWRDGKAPEEEDEEEDEEVLVNEVEAEEPPPSSDGDMVGRVMELDGDDLFDSSPPPPATTTITTTTPPAPSTPPATATTGEDMLLDDAELEALIRQGGEPEGNDDEDDWDALDEMEDVQTTNTTSAPPPPPAPAPTSAPAAEAPDDDDWLEYA